MPEGVGLVDRDINEENAPFAFRCSKNYNECVQGLIKLRRLNMTKATSDLTKLPYTYILEFKYSTVQYILTRLEQL